MNNTAIKRVFRDRIRRKYDLLHGKGSFLHWFYREGMEKQDFDDAREDLGFLEADYGDVLFEGTTSDYDDDEDEDY